MNIRTSTEDMLHVFQWKNGDKEWSPFSDAEMDRRQNEMRAHLAANDIDAAVFTSYHGICYYSGFLYCQFGRKFGFVLTADSATTVSAGIDGGQPWRRTHGDNVIYSDWRRDNFFTALKSLIPTGAKRVGIEFDHVSIDYRKLLGDAFPGVEFVDVAAASMWMRTLKIGLPITMKHHRDYEMLERADNFKPIAYPKPDGVLSFDRLTNVSFSYTNHAEDQPCHLKVADMELQRESELEVFAGPSARYCPAGVYEWILEEGAEPKFQINSQNCIHCKTCDIKDPNQNITWVTPEGGGGPNYPNM